MESPPNKRARLHDDEAPDLHAPPHGGNDNAPRADDGDDDSESSEADDGRDAVSEASSSSDDHEFVMPLDADG